MTSERTILAVVGILLLAGCGGGGGEASDTPAADRKPAGRLDWGQAFPVSTVTDLDGNAVSIPVDGGWTAAVLCSRACAACEADLIEYDARSIVWREMGLTFGVLSERDPGVLRESVVANGLEIPVWHTTTPLFQVTRILNEPVLTLVGPDGTVRFIGRRVGTTDERLVSLRRNFYYLNAPDSLRVALAARALPGAARVEIASTLETDWLGVSACQLGLSPWYGIGFAEDGSPSGFAFPIERDTNCDTCEPLYLMVGFGTDGRISALAEIEPVVSLGQPQDTGAFFRRFVGIRTREQVARVPERLVQSQRADEVTRELVLVAFALAERIPETESSAP